MEKKPTPVNKPWRGKKIWLPLLFVFLFGKAGGQGVGSWSLTGNAGTNPAVNFIGTTDAANLVFKVSSIRAGQLRTDGQVFFGYNSGQNITTGGNNVGLGYNALINTTTGSNNVAVGYLSMNANFGGNNNTATGRATLYSNTTGSNNSSFGIASLLYNTTGGENTGLGTSALLANTTGSGNTAVGEGAGSYNDANTNCTFVGRDADQASGFDFTNSMALGYGSRINADNQVRIGNTSITSIGGYASWSNLSDGRFKTNINSNVPGLDFIMRLQPVTYQFDSRLLNYTLYKGDARYANLPADNSLHTGFVAQEVEKAAAAIGYDFSGVDKPKNAEDFYGLRYSEFVVPLVKGMQEQQKIIEELKKEIELLKNKINDSGCPVLITKNEKP